MGSRPFRPRCIVQIRASPHQIALSSLADNGVAPTHRSRGRRFRLGGRCSALGFCRAACRRCVTVFVGALRRPPPPESAAVPYGERFGAGRRCASGYEWPIPRWWPRDGVATFVKTINATFPRLARQRCFAHRVHNLGRRLFQKFCAQTARRASGTRPQLP